MKHSSLGTRRVISWIITRNFFVTRNKQMTTGTNGLCISREDNCINTMCFPRQLPTTARNSLQRFDFVAFFDVCDTSCPVGKLRFSFILCDEFLKTYFLSMPQLSKYMYMYVSIQPNERFRKGASKLKIKVLGGHRIPCCNFVTACEEDTN